MRNVANQRRIRGERKPSSFRISAGRGVVLWHPLKVETRVRTPLGLPVKDQVRGCFSGSAPSAPSWKTQQMPVRRKLMWRIDPGQTA
jgi:hypothetical protein